MNMKRKLQPEIILLNSIEIKYAFLEERKHSIRQCANIAILQCTMPNGKASPTFAKIVIAGSTRAV